MGETAGIPKGRLSAILRSVLHFAGKGDRKVIAVFGISPDASQAAVHHVRQGAVGIPIWLFCTSPPSSETARLCERIFVCPNSALLLWRAERILWRCWVAL